MSVLANVSDLVQYTTFSYEMIDVWVTMLHCQDVWKNFILTS